MYTVASTKFHILFKVNTGKGGLQGRKSRVYNLYVSCSNDVNDQEKTIDDVLLEHVGLPNVLPFALHLEFFMLVG